MTDVVPFEAIFFDFDGVLVESADIKTRAFAQLYSAHGSKVVDEVVAYHEQNMGVSRFEKFRHIQKVILKGPELSTRQEMSLGDEFSSLVVNAVVNAAEVPGADAFLQRCRQRLSLFVISGTPQCELRDIVRRRGMNRLFVSVHGTPESKPTLAKRILSRYGFTASRVLMVGDSKTDFECARQCGLTFLGRVRAETPTPFTATTSIIADFQDAGLDEILRRLYE